MLKISGVKTIIILIFCFSSLLSAASEHHLEPPFKILFSNDFTNITLPSSFKIPGPWTIENLEGAVAETAKAGIDVHILQPAHTWVPWWQSDVYSMKEHYKWWYSRYGNYPNREIHEYILSGGDPFEDYIGYCRKHNQAAFVSLRINDGHHLNHVNKENNTAGNHAICKFYAENPQYRLGESLTDRKEYIQDWSYDAVREYKFSLIKEICGKYDIDGLEIDYLRHPYYFKDSVSQSEKEKIMTGFITRVRHELDKTSATGKHRWLSVRVPFRLKDLKRIGIDVAGFHNAGVDIFNLGCDYHMEQQNDLAQIHEQVPQANLYLETAYVTGGYRDPQTGKTYRHLTTDQQFYTLGHLAYSRGAKGISVFNFVYYRLFNIEPPFHIFKGLKDPQWLAKQPQHYYLSQYDADYKRVTKRNFLKETYSMDMAPPQGGWKKDGRLRIQSLAPGDFEDNKWQAFINGKSLEPAENVSEPYDNPYKKQKLKGREGRHLEGTVDPAKLRAWIIPPEILKDGINKITVSKQKEKGQIIYLDAAIE